MQHLLHEDTYLKQPWQAAIQWLHYEMERVSSDNVGTARCVILSFASQSFGCSITVLASDIEVVSNFSQCVVLVFFFQRPYVGTGYSYAGWSPPAQSNEASNG